VDTADMWKYLKKEIQPTKLANILHELGLEGWNLHNAGNDAVYTVQAMLGTAIKHITDKKKSDREMGATVVCGLTAANVGAMNRVQEGAWANDDTVPGVEHLLSSKLVLHDGKLDSSQ